MLLTLPLFVASLIWLRRWRFFKWDFLRRMTLLGLAGFSIYALLPLVNGLNPHSPWHFDEAWLATLKITKKTFGALYLEYRASRVGLLLACLWLAFDPSIGPRQILLRQFGIRCRC